MTAFATAIDALFADPNLGLDAVYRAGGADPGVPVRVIIRRPDRIGEYRRDPPRHRDARDRRSRQRDRGTGRRRHDRAGRRGLRHSGRADPRCRAARLDDRGAAAVRLQAAIVGELREVMADELRAAERAVTSGVRAASDGLKTELRGQIDQAPGSGRRLANTWRGEVYPKGQPSIGAAGYVWSKAPGIVRLYAEGGVIRSRHGLYLAIPLPAAGRFGDNRRKITPGAWERIHGLRLRFVYRRGRPSLLVADNARLTKRGRATANIGRSKGSAFTRLSGRTTVPVFILVPQVTVRKRLDVDGAARKWIGALPQLVLRHWLGSA